MGLYKYQKRDVKYMYMYGYYNATFGTVCYEINLQIVKDLLVILQTNGMQIKDAYQNLLHFM